MAISAVAAVFFLIGGLHIAAEISTINFGFFAFPADNAALHFLCHRFAQLVQQVCSDVLSGVSCGNGIGGGSVGGDLAAGPMYRFRVPELFLGCFLTVAVFAAGMLFVRWPYASNPAQAVKQQEASEQGSKAQRPDSELTGSTWLTKDAAGFFAFVLVVVGVGQAVLFFVQLSYMRKGMKEAEDAAKAANEAASAAKQQVEVAKAQIEVTKIGIFDLERAYLDASPSDIKTQFVTDPPSASGIYQRGDPMEIVAKVGLKNSGRTRAVITQVYGEFRTGTWLEDQPTYNLLIGRNYVTDLSMAANEEFNFLHDFRTQNVVEQFFFGFIAYTDIFKNTHTSRFCMRIFPPQENGGDARRQLAGNDAWREYD